MQWSLRDQYYNLVSIFDTMFIGNIKHLLGVSLHEFGLSFNPDRRLKIAANQNIILDWNLF